MRMSPDQHADLIAHAQEDAPNECCGYVTLTDGVVVEVVRGENVHHSPTRFELDKRNMFEAMRLEEEFDIAFYHSHPRSPAEPSQQDMNVMKEWPYLQLIVSLAAEPEVRAWWIGDRSVSEEPIELA